MGAGSIQSGSEARGPHVVQLYGQAAPELGPQGQDAVVQGG